MENERRKQAIRIAVAFLIGCHSSAAAILAPWQSLALFPALAAVAVLLLVELGAFTAIRSVIAKAGFLTQET